MAAGARLEVNTTVTPRLSALLIAFRVRKEMDRSERNKVSSRSSASRRTGVMVYRITLKVQEFNSNKFFPVV
jgi:hypothetical protein